MFNLKNKHIKISSKSSNIGEKIVENLINFSNTATYFYGGYKLLDCNPHYINSLLKNSPHFIFLYYKEN